MKSAERWSSSIVESSDLKSLAVVSDSLSIWKRNFQGLVGFLSDNIGIWEVSAVLERLVL
jgi:hypothetical protein